MFSDLTGPPVIVGYSAQKFDHPDFGASFSMHHLQRISVAMAVVGGALVAIALIANLDALWTLTGLLLAWAGIVKIVITMSGPA